MLSFLTSDKDPTVRAVPEKPAGAGCPVENKMVSFGRTYKWIKKVKTSSLLVWLKSSVRCKHDNEMR